jgi:ABC-2 type transport system permease protein
VRNIILIASKELRSYLTSPMAYIVVCIFLLLSGLFFVLYLQNTSFNDTSIQGFIDPLSVFGVQSGGNILLLLFAVILTMRTLAEEKKLGTLELLLTSPVRDSDVVLGKFLASMGILTIMLILTFLYPLLLIILGDPDMGPIWTSYLGLFLLGTTALSIGIFASSLTANQIVAAVVSGAILFALWVLGIVASSVPEGLQAVLNYMSISYHSVGFEAGVIDTRDIIYYISITALFLYFSIRSLEASRWS